MSKNPSDWREKYLDSLDQRDKLQEQTERRQELMRRALVRVSLAAGGQDDRLDKDLARLRASVNSEAKLSIAVDQVEKTILKLEQITVNGTGNIGRKALSALARGLLELVVQRDTRSAIKDLMAEINASTGVPPEAVMQRLADLQQKVMTERNAAQSVSKNGLLGRIWQRSGDSGEPIVVNTELDNRPEPPPATTGEFPHATAVAQPNPGIAECASIAAAASVILQDMVNKVEPAEQVREKAAQTRQKLQGGLTWQQLVPALEDVRDLVVQSYLAAGDAHREYLLHMQQQLEDLVVSVGGITSAHKLDFEADLQLENDLVNQLDCIGETVQASTELSVLKKEIENNLTLIRTALDRRQKARADSSTRGQLDMLETRLQQVEEEAKCVKLELETQKYKALTDALTGLPNREAYNQRAVEEWERRGRFQHPLTLVVCDIDRFKGINDNFGHQTGDRVLQVLAKTISQRLRSVDFIARYGGEEFVILLPDTIVADAWQLMEKIRSAIAEAPFRFKQQPLRVTLSMGLVEVLQEETVDEAFRRADGLLYQAKQEGRNRCLMQT